MQDIWKWEKHCIWSGIVYSDHNGKTTYSGQFVAQLTLCIVCLMGNGSDGEMGMLVPTLFH